MSETFVVDGKHVSVMNRQGITAHFFEFLGAFGIGRNLYKLGQADLEQITATQEEYYQAELISLSHVESSLKIYGWDDALMNRPEYLEALRELTQRKEPVIVHIVVPADVRNGALASLEAGIRTMPTQPATGYAILDNSEISCWDTTRHTVHRAERDSVIYRFHSSKISEVTKLLAHFSKAYASAQK